MLAHSDHSAGKRDQSFREKEPVLFPRQNCTAFGLVMTGPEGRNANKSHPVANWATLACLTTESTRSIQLARRHISDTSKQLQKAR